MDLNINGNDTLLDKTQHEIFVHLLPVIVFLAIAAFVGIAGNILTIIFYSSKCKRSAFTVQIVCLASVDLLVCCMIIPRVIEMVVNVKHNQKILCKLTNFFGMWTISSSCFILWIIALNRHRRICKPFAKQMKVKAMVQCFIGSIVFTFFLSVRNFANYDISTVKVPVQGSNETVSGFYCTRRNDSGYKISVFVFTLIDFLLILMILITLIVCYTLIICTLLSLNRTKKEDCPTVYTDPNINANVGERKESELSTETHHSNSCNETCNKVTPDIETSDFKGLENTPAASGLSSSHTIRVATDSSLSFSSPTNSDGIISDSRDGGMTVSQNGKYRCKIAARSPLERNLTFMMFTVSFIFILCFFPYFAVRIIMRFEFEHAIGIQFVVGLIYFNSVFNPIVYCFFNPQFRRYIKSLFLR